MNASAHPERLTQQQRACLLRCARRQLQDYTAALERMVNSPGHFTEGQIDALRQEIQCVQSAVHWIWREQIANP